MSNVYQKERLVWARPADPSFGMTVTKILRNWSLSLAEGGPGEKVRGGGLCNYFDV